MKFAIIQIGSKQYNIEEGKEYEISRFNKEGKVSITEVLAAGEGDKIIVGAPFVDKAKVELTILDQTKGEKVVSRIYKAKARYRRKRGSRKLLTKIKVEKITY